MKNIESARRFPAMLSKISDPHVQRFGRSGIREYLSIGLEK